MAQKKYGPSLFREHEFKFPGDPETIAIFREATTGMDRERDNAFRKIRWVDPQQDGNIVQETDFPAGDIKLLTIRLCLVRWNVLGEDGNILPINERALNDYIPPDITDKMYEFCLEINPAWGGKRVEAKN